MEILKDINEKTLPRQKNDQFNYVFPLHLSVDCRLLSGKPRAPLHQPRLGSPRHCDHLGSLQLEQCARHPAGPECSRGRRGESGEVQPGLRGLSLHSPDWGLRGPGRVHPGPEFSTLIGRAPMRLGSHWSRASELQSVACASNIMP